MKNPACPGFFMDGSIHPRVHSHRFKPVAMNPWI